MNASKEKSPARTRVYAVAFGTYDRSSKRGLGPARLEGFTRTSMHWYTDAEGRRLFRIDRYRAPGGAREMDTVYTLGVKERPRVLYRLPRVLAAISRGETVYLAEGETDVEALETLGVVATCAPYGAYHWSEAYTRQLRRAHVIVVADDDEAGWLRVAMLLNKLEGVVASGRIVKPAIPGGDARDHIEAGLGLGDFIEVPAVEVAR